MTHGEKTITFKPGMIVHIPAGVAYSMKAAGGGLTLADFVQLLFDSE